MGKLMAETGLTQEALHRLTEPLVRSNRLLRIPDDVLLTEEALASAAERFVGLAEGAKPNPLVSVDLS